MLKTCKISRPDNPLRKIVPFFHNSHKKWLFATITTRFLKLQLVIMIPLEIRDYLKKIEIYNTRSKKNTVFDSLIVTTLNGTMFLVVHFAPLLA